jgi:hypothetical protein
MFIKVRIGLAEPMRGGDMIRYLLMSQRSRKNYNGFKRVQGDSKVIPTQFRSQRYKLLVENNGNK